MLPTISGEFGVTQEPEMRFSNDGKPWLKVRCVAKDRFYNRDTNQWEDKPDSTLFIDITVGGKAAEHLAESVVVGDHILVTNGTLTMREWQSDDGKRQKAYSIRANDVGVSVRFGPAPTSKNRGTSAPAQAPKQADESPW